ncbi:argininosuccinate lyase [Draconibacterium halophilum]|uniref:Argininosuccinate lyase n=1 Tax=Draconibacterium halophilum TaxID=2706887 RepID=A0A6C0RK94_9BACT|nr:argininosuccinate lyase [Draconibacterium halophilum]QIA09671.1 argininosuccinate lyase [Draconibacterium halophilum]
MKLWDKGTPVNKAIEEFTVGKDRELDLFLATHDILGSMAHVTMLESVGLIEKDELPPLLSELKNLYARAEKGEFTIDEGVEDIHSQVEFLLTEKLGDLGKKIHSGRSRNDQVLLDLKLFTRDAIKEITETTSNLIDTLLKRAEETKGILMPGYTHLQVAMPSSFGLWFSAYAESLADDLELLLSAFKITNQNPLGSAAGYGSSFPLNRQMTTDLLGFATMNYNVVYAQMGRGKVEKIVSFALANLAGTLSKLAYDVCIFMSQNFNFVSLPTEFTTGSSIMPHKKNPDVFELTRARCNKLQGVPSQISLIINNLPSGYFRDLQMVKEIFLPSFKEMNDCLNIVDMAIDKMSVNKEILNDSKYDYLFSVEEVNKLVLQGIPFREAYKQIGAQIESGNFTPEKSVNHNHEGSIGNLCLDSISNKKEEIINKFLFNKIKEAKNNLLK